MGIAFPLLNLVFIVHQLSRRREVSRHRRAGGVWQVRAWCAPSALCRVLGLGMIEASELRLVTRAAVAFPWRGATAVCARVYSLVGKMKLVNIPVGMYLSGTIK